jgi:hypothetical protein
VSGAKHRVYIMNTHKFECGFLSKETEKSIPKSPRYEEKTTITLFFNFVVWAENDYKNILIDLSHWCL